MARRESAHSVRQGCFHPEWCSPFVRVMAKQRRSVVPAAVMHLVEPRWQAKSRATLSLPVQANSRVKTAGWRPPLLELPASSLAMERALSEANSRAIRRVLLQADSRVKTAPLEANSRAIRPVLIQANSRVKTADPPSPGLRRAS